MSKEFPFFRFYVSEWLNDEITFESYKTKGVFADVCAFYWARNCDINKQILLKKFKDAKSTIQELLENGIIKGNSNDNKIEIKFLDEQHVKVKEDKRKRQEAGRIGGKASAEVRSSKPFSND